MQALFIMHYFEMGIMVQQCTYFVYNGLATKRFYDQTFFRYHT